MSLRRAWASVRPRTRRGAVLAAAGILAGAAVLSGVFLVGAAMAWNPYLQFTLDREVDARRWASLELSYASSSGCAECHAPQQVRLELATHEGIGCQSCHGALLEHVEAGEAADAATVAIAVPTNEVCLRCHTAAAGRPGTLRQVVPADHYVSSCLECHDPHTGVANRPPVVLHPLEALPACLTCHGPEGFKARAQRHPEGSVDDDRCLACHAKGRGPDEDEWGTQ